MEERIWSLAGDLTSPAEGEKALLELLCAAARERWQGALRPGITPEDCTEPFLCACAFTAAAGLLRSRSGGEVSFTAGAVRVEGGGEAKAADALERQARQLLALWTEGESFAFRGVRA